MFEYKLGKGHCPNAKSQVHVLGTGDDDDDDGAVDGGYNI